MTRTNDLLRIMRNDDNRKIVVMDAGVVRLNKATGNALNGVLNRKAGDISLWDAIWDSAMAEQTMYAEFLAIVYSEMAEAEDNADFLDPILKHADLVDAALWVKSFWLWGKRCVEAGTVASSDPILQF